MPTLDDLRAVLLERESVAGDADSVLAALDEPRRRPIVPVLAGAAIVVAAAGVAVAVTGHDPAHQPVGGGQLPSASSTPFMGTPPPATTAPPHQDTALTWGFSFAPVPGYTAQRTYYDPYKQIAEVSGPHGYDALITIYSRGAFDTAGLSGDEVTADGKRLTSGTTRVKIVWQYAEDSWAMLQTMSATGDTAHRRAVADQLVAAIHVGQSGHVTAPLAMPELPSQFSVEAVYPSSSDGACIGYGTGDAYPPPKTVKTHDLGTVLTVCRQGPRQMGLEYVRAGDRRLTRDLPDGGSLVLLIDADHVDEFSQADLADFAKNADVSPKFTDRSTWLPVES